MTTSTEANKAAIVRFRAALNAGDLDAALAVFAPEAVIHMAGAPGPTGVQDFAQFGRAMLGAFSGASSTVEDTIAEGDKVVTRITFRGTQTAEMMGIPATGRSVEISETIIDQFANGRIIQSWRLFDQMTMMQQLGLIPAPGQGGG